MKKKKCPGINRVVERVGGAQCNRCGWLKQRKQRKRGSEYECNADVGEMLCV